jgi:formylglycine-generating enzyme required for sulfatase activity
VYYGSSPELALKYSVIATHRPAETVATRKPNDYGIFDILGNLCEWTRSLDKADLPRNQAVACGGHFATLPDWSDLSLRDFNSALDISHSAIRFHTFRVVRSLPQSE